jgi:hypothetical protein
MEQFNDTVSTSWVMQIRKNEAIIYMLSLHIFCARQVVYIRVAWLTKICFIGVADIRTWPLPNKFSDPYS